MDAVFYFLFHEQDFGSNEPKDRQLAFYLTNLNRPWSEIENDVYGCEDQLEMKYGMHNWLGYSWLGYSGGEANVLGYSSYEVKEHHHNELMEKWRQAFVGICPDCEISAVYELPHDAINDAEILQFTKAAHEHTQAQKMRDTLTTHVSARGSAAQQKKM